LFDVDLPHFVSACAGVLDGGQIGNLMELCDTTTPSIFCELGAGGHRLRALADQRAHKNP
jgi:hypothetical protein